MCLPTIRDHGSEEIRKRFLKPGLRGEEMWCQLFSEPDAGSDLAGLKTSAERDGDRWIINGSKVWTTGGHASRRAVLMARTDPSADRHSGISFFILDMKQPGVAVSVLRDMTGDEEFNQVSLTDVEVDHEDVIGELGEGWRVAMTMLQHERDADAVGHDGGGDGKAGLSEQAHPDKLLLALLARLLLELAPSSRALRLRVLGGLRVALEL